MNMGKKTTVADYYEGWIRLYKEGAVRKVTWQKYQLTLSWLRKLAPKLAIGKLDRSRYQELINDYAATHERQTVLDFHHQLKGAFLDAADEGLLPSDPTRKVIIKGVDPRPKRRKFLNQFELHTLLSKLRLDDEHIWDWLIMLIAKTGLRYSEALALTPEDFDFSKQTISVRRTWDYKSKEGGAFQPTKNASSVRKLRIDWQTASQFASFIKGKDAIKPIFGQTRTHNSTANGVLRRRCEEAGIAPITIHGLRHTHASLLLFAGVSVGSVARRLGHSSMATTQKVYLHVIQELENQDLDLIMRSMAGI